MVPAKIPLSRLALARLTCRQTPRLHQSKPARTYATGRRQVTVVNDDGRINWTELSGREKVARTTQQSFNLVIIVTGVVMTAAVGYLVFSDVLSPNSQTAQFNRAVNRIKASEICTKLLGPANTITAFGDSPWSSYRRARIAGPSPYINVSKDPKTGLEQIKMRFLVRGSKDEGWVTLHMQWNQPELEYEYLLLALDIQGHRRIFLEGGQDLKTGPSAGNLFGIRWK